MKNRPEICVVGSVNLDFIIRTADLPSPGETIGAGEFFTAPGGKGANQALAAQRLGADVSMLACVGDDEFAETALANLESAGVNLDGVARLTGEASGAAFINLSHDGENQIAVAPGANARFSPPHIIPVTADAMIAQLEVPLDTIAAAAASVKDCFFCVNTAPALPVDVAFLHRADLLVMNEIEFAYYQDQLSDYQGTIASTYGAKGAVLSRGGEKIASCAAPTVAAIDTTGAGDCFTAALTLALIEDLPPHQALWRACVSAALATTKIGAQAGMPLRADVDAYIAQHPTPGDCEVS